MDSLTLPTLYSLDKNGRERMWRIWTEDCVIHSESGLVDGKKVPSKRACKGVNIGKSNETTPIEQAKRVAETKWIKKLDQNYTPKCKEGKAMVEKVMRVKAESGGHNINASASIRGRSVKKTKTVQNLKVGNLNQTIIPMKAKVWELVDGNCKTPLPKILKHFNFDDGVYLQWKLDGWRCVARIYNGNVVLTTNSGKEYPWFQHIRREVAVFLDGREELALNGLDCELYAHRIEEMTEDGPVGMDDQSRFQTITSACGMRRSEPHPLEGQMCLYVFDLIDLSGKYDQDERFERLKALFKRKPKECSHIVLTDTRVANYPEEIATVHDEYAANGYEGVIIRARDLMYKCKHRSSKMMKYKHFIDREYRIVDVHKDQGVDDEHFTWVCEDRELVDEKTGGYKRFRAKPMGCREDRRDWYENYVQHIGRLLTVKFQEYTEDGVPRFPIAKAFRNEEDISRM